jgi:hypothetical protein
MDDLRFDYNKTDAQIAEMLHQTNWRLEQVKARIRGDLLTSLARARE